MEIYATTSSMAGNTSDSVWNGSASTRACSNDYCESDEDYLTRIHNYVFPTPFEWVMTILYVIVFAVGLTGNALVCYVVWRNAHMRTVTNVFIVNLSVADLLVIVVCLPPTALADITETWYLGVAMCKIVGYIQGVSVSVSVLTLTVISIERYFAIVHPLRFRSTLCRTRISIGAVWAASCSLLLPELVILDVEHLLPAEFTRFLAACRSNWPSDRQTAYLTVQLVVLFVLPLVVMTFAYIQIARRLWTSLAVNIPDSPPIESSTMTSLKRVDPRQTMRTSRCSSYDVNTRMRARRNVAKMLIVVVIIFAVCYLPVHLFSILRYAGVKIGEDIAPVFALIAHWLCYFNSAINPVIYNLMSARFLKSFKRACWCMSTNEASSCHCCRCLRLLRRFCRRCCCRDRNGNRKRTFSAMFMPSCRTATSAVTSSSHSDPMALGIIVVDGAGRGGNPVAQVSYGAAVAGAGPDDDCCVEVNKI